MAKPKPGRRLHEALETPTAFLEIEVDLDKLTVSLSGATTAGRIRETKLGKFASWDKLCDGYPELWRGVIAKYGEPRGHDDDLQPLDLRAERVRAERRAAARAANASAGAAWEAKLAKARAVLTAFTGQAAAKRALPAYFRDRDDVDLSGSALAKSLEYVIAVGRIRAKARTIGPIRSRHKARAVRLGASKFGGLPHLPADLEWPTLAGEPMYLLAQLDLAEIAAVDVSGQVPDRGTLYAFITESAGARILYTESRTLKIRKPDFKVKSYMKRLVGEDEALLTFSPAFYFRQTSDTGGPGAIAEALPASLRNRVAKILGCSPEPCGAFGGDRIFGGDPVDWQAMGRSYLKTPLFAQLHHSEGHQSIGVDLDDLRIGWFADAECRYCGT